MATESFLRKELVQNSSSNVYRSVPEDPIPATLRRSQALKLLGCPKCAEE